MKGQIISHYRVVGELGRGGMGVVYRAQDTRLKREVALKCLPPGVSTEPMAVERFRREAEIISALNHPNICTLHDIGEHEGQQFIVFELLEGQSLRGALAADPLPVARVVALALQIADALDAAHARGVIHRDLKPANIWVTSRGNAKVLDFGIARLIVSDDRLDASTQIQVTGPGDAIGTPHYMAPEQVRGEPADQRADLFALGVVMYEMATSRLAFPGATVGLVLDAVLNRTPEPPSRTNPRVPAALDQIVLKAMEKDAALRYQSARDLIADLHRLTRDLTPQSQPSLQPLSSVWRRRLKLGLTAALVAAGTLGLWWFVLPQPGESDSPTAVLEAGVGPARVVVLPFENLTRQPSDDWLAGAFSDALSAGLQPILDIVLVPRERVVELYAAEFRQESQSLSSDLARQISEKLRVRYYVHGSYQRVGDDLRVTARLVDAEKGTLEAQETLTNRIANLFTLEDDLAARFASSLGGRVARTMPPGETPPLEAYQAVSDARADYALGRLDEARVLLRRAVDQAPRYALAWAWLSKTNARIAAPANFGGKQARIDLLREALAEASTAVSLQPGLVDGEIALALVYRGLVQPAAQRAAAERAVALDPRNGEALGLIAESNAMSASFGCPRDPLPELAEEQFRDALRIDPLHGNVRLSLTTHLWWMNRQTEAFAASDEGLSMVPNSAVLNTWRPFNMAFAGRSDEAFALWRTNTRGVSELKPIDAFIAAIIELKRRNFATADDYFKRAGSQAHTLPFPLIAAVAHFQVGRMTEGTAFLQRGFQASADCVAWFDRVPAFAPFKNHPAVRKALDRSRQTGPV